MGQNRPVNARNDTGVVLVDYYITNLKGQWCREEGLTAKQTKLPSHTKRDVSKPRGIETKTDPPIFSGAAQACSMDPRSVGGVSCFCFSLITLEGTDTGCQEEDAGNGTHTNYYGYQENYKIDTKIDNLRNQDEQADGDNEGKDGYQPPCPRIATVNTIEENYYDKTPYEISKAIGGVDDSNQTGDGMGN